MLVWSCVFFIDRKLADFVVKKKICLTAISGKSYRFPCFSFFVVVEGMSSDLYSQQPRVVPCPVLVPVSWRLLS
jgi:hypothetical protein